MGVLGEQVALRFSPLLDGDGVASRAGYEGRSVLVQFQSPSRWGRCCIHSDGDDCIKANIVSVPFSMGTVLHHRSHARKIATLIRFRPLLDGDGVASFTNLLFLNRNVLVSVPFSMGTVLHRAGGTGARLGIPA